ncbi:catechol 2,3-dioxygenase-like lactoylglutathione lyase family enzyme [Acetoanaerobium pronyense]|uniref:Catechol 2,3-dioxygenase-like lactoylglutathione lyase family enzyme n=1 Tax=Acetoanaerobium pronyense TaxID=1482736 RepID=A0ABS4KI88_9FIRM|nr:VOC family protein [Acetoanaerobium pronyense]MBP2027497.1 catechol 2,3-dioxygenase-like lactoylglutathione lyase family enzyme [Acetoanaerobium pronyense]
MQNNYDGLIVFLGTMDLEATDRFYKEVLGLTLYKDQGLCKIYDVPGGGKIGFCSHLSICKSSDEPIITLVTKDVDLAYVNLTTSGMHPHGEPQVNTQFNIKNFFTTDPNGYIVEIQSFLDEGGIDI